MFFILVQTFNIPDHHRRGFIQNLPFEPKSKMRLGAELSQNLNQMDRFTWLCVSRFSSRHWLFPMKSLIFQVLDLPRIASSCKPSSSLRSGSTLGSIILNYTDLHEKQDLLNYHQLVFWHSSGRLKCF